MNDFPTPPAEPLFTGWTNLDQYAVPVLFSTQLQAEKRRQECGTTVRVCVYLAPKDMP